MERREFEERPEDLEPAADWLRAQRPEVSALELDRIKQRARAQAMRGERRGAGAARPRRALSTAITVLALTVGLGGAFAIAGKGPPSSPQSAGSSAGSAAFDQYCPPGPAGKKCRKQLEKECLKQAEQDKKDFEAAAEAGEEGLRAAAEAGEEGLRGAAEAGQEGLRSDQSDPRAEEGVRAAAEAGEERLLRAAEAGEERLLRAIQPGEGRLLRAVQGAEEGLQGAQPPPRRRRLAAGRQVGIQPA